MKFQNFFSAFALACLAGLLPQESALALVEMETNDSPGDIGVQPFTPGADILTGNFDQCPNLLCDDYWEFTAQAGNSYTFVVTPTGCTTLQANNTPDVGIEIHDAANALVTPPGFVDLNAQCITDSTPAETISNWIAPSSGTFYIVIFEATNTATSGVAQYSATSIVTGGTPTPTPAPTVVPTATPVPTPTLTPTPHVNSARDWEQYE